MHDHAHVHSHSHPPTRSVDLVVLEDGMPKGEEHPPTDVAIDTRIRLPIVTVASRRKMNQLREFVGSVHHFCPNWYECARSRVSRVEEKTMDARAAILFFH